MRQRFILSPQQLQETITTRYRKTWHNDRAKMDGRSTDRIYMNMITNNSKHNDEFAMDKYIVDKRLDKNEQLNT